MSATAQPPRRPTTRPAPRATSRRRLTAIAAATAAVLGTVACGDGEATTEGTGLAGTTITVYSGRSEELVGPLLEQFTAETGIAVELRAGDSGELAAQLLTEGDASPADVFFSQDAGALGAVESAGLFSELPTELLDVVPAAYRSADGTWVGTSGRVRVLVINPDLVPDAPTTIDELLDPQWKGLIGFAPTNASWQSFVTGLRVIRGDEAARTWLEAFAANEPVPFEKNGAVRDAVNSGEVAIGLVNHYYLYELVEAEGAENVVAVNQFLSPGDPGGLVNVAGVGVPTSAPHRAAALALVEYLLSQAGQTYFSEQTNEYPLRDGVALTDGLPTLADLQPPAIDLSDLRSIAATQEMLDEVGLLTR